MSKTKWKRSCWAEKVINRNYDFVDKVRDLVFEDDIYDGKPLGTVTIFQDDIRISTNVRDADGERSHRNTWCQKLFMIML